MRKSNKKKLITLVVSLVVLSALVIGGTIMFLQDKTEEVTNTFNPSEVTCEINEDFDGTSKKNVTVTSTSDIDAYLRAAIVVNWVDDAGNILGQPVGDDEYVITGKSAKWEQGSDGYYYYTDKVAPGGTTENLIGECKLASGVSAPAGYYLSVTILADAIQADPQQARIDAGWVIK